jgi:cobalt-precorrin-5B (C1)-methyltransferase
VASNGKRLRSGFTTGACAAAAAKAAVMFLIDPGLRAKVAMEVDIPFPDGARVLFVARFLGVEAGPTGPAVSAEVIKDGGDDPDVTSGAGIRASATIRRAAGEKGDTIIIKGGEGVGIVTKPGLSAPQGEAAITPVPRGMIAEAVTEALPDRGENLEGREIDITVSVPGGEVLARKTLNGRLGITGGISILGTTGIVRPLSAEAWTSTIAASMDVAVASGISEIVLSVGRVSEKAHMKRYRFPDGAYVMMGDYFAFSLGSAREHGFRRIHVSAQWAKMLKISMATPETHVRHGAIDAGKAVGHLTRMGVAVSQERDFNTAREIYTSLATSPGFPFPLLGAVCDAVKRYAERMSGGIPVIVHLVSYEGDILGDGEEGTDTGHRL